MVYDEELVNRIRAFLATKPELKVEEKEMFRCLTFMVNGKMCVSVSGNEMMVRFDPALQEAFAERNGFRIMETKNGPYKGHGYVSPEAIRTRDDFAFWMKQCLDFNPYAKASSKKKK